jgi:hypothetical protein
MFKVNSVLGHSVATGLCKYYELMVTFNSSLANVRNYFKIYLLFHYIGRKNVKLL